MYADKVPKMREDVFKGCDAKKCTIYVPKGTYGDYRSSDFGYFENYCCPVKLFKQNKLGLSLLTKYQPFWLSLFC